MLVVVNSTPRMSLSILIHSVGHEQRRSRSQIRSWVRVGGIERRLQSLRKSLVKLLIRGEWLDVLLRLIF